MEFIYYFGDVFAPISFLLLLVGTIGGLILGATPGLSPTMAVALLIPFTFHLEAVQGLILLGAAYTSTVAGGAVSAILLKIPGRSGEYCDHAGWSHHGASRARARAHLQL